MDSDEIQMLQLRERDVHVVTLANHRRLNASVYGAQLSVLLLVPFAAFLKSVAPGFAGSVALLKPAQAGASSVSKTHMKIRATSLGAAACAVCCSGHYTRSDGYTGVTSFDWPNG